MRRDVPLYEKRFGDYNLGELTLNEAAYIAEVGIANVIKVLGCSTVAAGVVEAVSPLELSLLSDNPIIDGALMYSIGRGLELSTNLFQYIKTEPRTQNRNN